MIITISRENGSGGAYVGEQLSKKLSLPVYDSKLITTAAAEAKLDIREALENDEISTNDYLEKGALIKSLFNKKSTDEALYANEKRIILNLAASGEDCIIVGRTSNYILKDAETIDVFLFSSSETFKIKRKVEYNGLSEEDAIKAIRAKDKQRATYFQYHTGMVWGKKENYDLCIDTYKTGVDTAGDLIALLYQKRKEVK